MPETIDLGTISAGVELNLADLTKGVAQFKAQMASLQASLKTQTAAIRSQIGTLGSAFTKLSQSGVAQKIGRDFQVAGAGAAAGLGLAAKAAADFQSKMQTVANNTTMTTRDLNTMKSAVTDLARQSGASFDDLAQGFAHVTNFGNSAASSVVILREAMKSAVATGSKVSDTADILAKSLHEFSLKASDAGHAMNVMHLAAAQGNMTLQQFDQAAGPAFAQAANLGVGLTEVSAAMSALTRHGLDASEAATQVKDILVHMINPSKQARQELELLSARTGINLVQDFSQAGLKAKGLTGVLDDLARATNGNGQEIYKLIQAQRGGLGAMILAGTGAKDYKDILTSLNDAMSGKIDPTTKAYRATLETVTNQMQRLRADVETLGVKLGSVLLPQIREGVQWLTKLADGFKDLNPEMQTGIVKAGLLAAGIGLIGGKVLETAANLVRLKNELGVAGLAFGGLKTAATEATTAAGGMTTATGGLFGLLNKPFAIGGLGALLSKGLLAGAAIGGTIIIAWSLKGAYETLTNAKGNAARQSANDQVAQIEAQRRAAVTISPGQQAAQNRTAADNIRNSDEFKGYSARVKALKADIARYQSAPEKYEGYSNAGLQKRVDDLKTALAEVVARHTKMLTDVANLRSDALFLDSKTKSNLPPKIARYSADINAASAKYGVDANLIAAVITRESDGNPKEHSKAGAMGLMQLMPDNARENGVTDPYNVRQNIMAGTHDLAEFIKQYKGDLHLALAAYNAGPGNVKKYGGIPPFKETQNYVKRVMGTYAEYGGGVDASDLPAYVARAKAMLGRTGEKLADECVKFVANGLRGGTAALKRARNVPLNPSGQYPTGTILHLKAGGRGTTAHVLMVDNDSGRSVALEDMTPRSGGVRGPGTIVNRRPVSSLVGRITSAQMPRPEDILPASAPGYYDKIFGKSSLNFGKYVKPVDTEALADLQKRAFAATHSEFANRRYEAKTQYGQDKAVDPKLALVTYRATLRQIAKDEAEARQQERDALKRHHTEIERQHTLHQAHILAIAQRGIRTALTGVKQNTRDMFASSVAALDIPKTLLPPQMGASTLTAIITRAQAMAADAGGSLQSIDSASRLLEKFGNLTPKADKSPKKAKPPKEKEEDTPQTEALQAIPTLMGSLVSQSIQKWEGFRSFFKEMAGGLKDILAQMVGQMVEKWVAGHLVMNAATAQLGAAVMGLAALSGKMGKKKQSHSLLGGILGGVAGSFLGPVGWLKGAEFGSAIGGMFAGGGRPPIGVPSIIGERGPELFVPDRAGTIIPNGKFGMGGGTQITVNHHGDIVNGDGMARGADDLAWAITKRLAVTS